MYITSSNYNSGGGCMLRDIRMTVDGKTRYFLANEEGIVENDIALFDTDEEYDASEHELWYVSYDGNYNVLEILEVKLGCYTAAVLAEVAKFYDADEEPPYFVVPFGKSKIAVALNSKSFMFVFEQQNDYALVCELDPTKTLLQHLIFADFHLLRETDITGWRSHLISDVLYDIQN